MQCSYIQLMTDGRGKVEEGREEEEGERENGSGLGWEERGRRKRRGITHGWSEWDTGEEEKIGR